MSRLHELELELRDGMKRSRQSSYSRRAPDPSAVPYLNRARDGLRELKESEPTNPYVWELLSKAEECFLNYPEAIKCLKKSVELTGHISKSQRKRIAMLKEASKQWKQLDLTPEDLRSLGAYLKSVGADEAIDRRSFEHTELWLANEGFSNPEIIIEQLENKGAYSDFQVYHNIVLG